MGLRRRRGRGCWAVWRGFRRSRESTAERARRRPRRCGWCWRLGRGSRRRARHALALLDLHRDNYDAAARWLEGARALYRETEAETVAGPQYVSSAYALLGRIALAQGDTERATTYLDEGLRQLREQDFIWRLSDTLRSLGDLARDRGDLNGAMERYAESAKLAEEHGDLLFLANALTGIASVAAARRQPERAARSTERRRRSVKNSAPPMRDGSVPRTSAGSPWSGGPVTGGIQCGVGGGSGASDGRGHCRGARRCRTGRGTGSARRQSEVRARTDLARGRGAAVARPGNDRSGDRGSALD